MKAEKVAHLDEANQSVLANVVDEIAERLKRGESPRIEEYAARCPELQTSLHRTYAALVRMRKLVEDWTERMESAGDLQPARQLGDFRILRELRRGCGRPLHMPWPRAARPAGFFRRVLCEDPGRGGPPGVRGAKTRK